ncbi:unnamed protein product [Phytomonas sp. EM1]|nr:unnamed protein product [Phytomonas sp. EM1]|eukprot:CCW63187.1 unnamed protein product [Phytomonas sp. isolate EM1]
MRSVLLFFAVLIALTRASADVVELTSKNFDEVIAKDGITFIKFFTTWCGYCKKAAPEFANASDILKDVATLAEVDCDKERNICKRFEVNGYPKFLLFRKGVNISTFSGQRVASEMVDYVKVQMASDTNSVSSEEEFEKVKSENPRVCLIKTKSDETELAKLVNKLIPKYKATYRFVVINDEKVSPDDSMESITVYRKGDDKEVFDGNLSSEALSTFLDKAPVMFIGTLSPESIPFYSKLSHEKIGILLMGSETTDERIADLRLVAKKYRNKITVISFEGESNEVSKNIGLPEDTKYPAFVLTHDNTAYPHPTDIQANSSTIDAFMQKYLNGEVKPIQKSQPIPEEPTKDGLTILVGKTIDSYIKKGKNLMIFFNAPWCGHCNKLHPIYDEFAKSHGSDNLIISKIDGTANDFNRTMFNVNGFPTIYFIPAGSQEAMFYNGKRTVEDLAAFVKKHMKEPVEPKQEDLEGGDL